MKPYACFDRPPFRTAVPMQDGWRTVNFTRDGGTREPVMVSAPFRMEMDCNYRTTELGRADPRCAGCKHQIKNEEGIHGTTS